MNEFVVVLFQKTFFDQILQTERRAGTGDPQLARDIGDTRVALVFDQVMDRKQVVGRTMRQFVGLKFFPCLHRRRTIRVKKEAVKPFDKNLYFSCSYKKQ